MQSTLMVLKIFCFFITFRLWRKSVALIGGFICSFRVGVCSSAFVYFYLLINDASCF